MATQCYAMVRGSVIRLTRLDSRGRVVEGERSTVTTNSVAKISINEVSDTRPGLLEKNEVEEIRIYSPDQNQTIYYTADIEFLRTDPDAIEIVTGQEAISDNALGFGLSPFGETPFGLGAPVITGFDVSTHRPVSSFALEVWSRLEGGCDAQYGYTLFPFLRGGRLSPVTFANGLINFSVRGSRTVRGSRWGFGPYTLRKPNVGWDTSGWDMVGWDNESDDQRLLTSVPHNRMWHTEIVDTAPSPTEGAVPLYDVINGGTAALTTDDTIEGGTAALTTPESISGGAA